MSAKGVIVPTQHECGEYILPLFVANKKDGSRRIILTLISLNNHGQQIRLRTLNCFMASIDLKDAYYSVPIAELASTVFKTCVEQQLVQVHKLFQWAGFLSDEASICNPAKAWSLVVTFYISLVVNESTLG